MNIMRILKYVGLVLLAALATFVIWLAISNGNKAAQGRQVAKDAKSIQQGLEYFYTDQNRYPSIGEFGDVEIMRQYLNNFPPQEFKSGVCEKSFDYTNTFRNDYELRICLPKGVRGYESGWNAIKSPVK